MDLILTLFEKIDLKCIILIGVFLIQYGYYAFMINSQKNKNNFRKIADKQDNVIKVYNNKREFFLKRFMLPNFFLIMTMYNFISVEKDFDLIQTILVVLAIIISVLFGFQTDNENRIDRYNKTTPLNKRTHDKIISYLQRTSNLIYITINDSIICIFLCIFTYVKFDLFFLKELELLVRGFVLFYFSRSILSVFEIVNNLRGMNSIDN